ncbi:Ger(x)C family spore germination protein [Lysinibacillus macroides]|uniref:Spore gernimation protein n=1 Tax=Lysinibacillus macroides TaxID=33935 RepID=A0A0N0CVN6_9BACI|nr:Ger(x)C family spore germination protein [Lysinibacillus macroides]KOY81637.1 spore gernimation protein [Lysinibacillus macroides]QPR69516.1 Ger(x)C family spore germination protein [Lysinibacillus macroides]
MAKVKGIGLLCILTLLLSGCWSKRELNELAIVVALGIDKVEDHYEITVQIVDPSEISVRQVSTQRAPVITYHAQGETIFEAIRKMTTVAARKPYFSHLQVVVLGEDLAKEGIDESLDLIARDHEFRNDFDVIMSYEATAKEVLNILTPIEKIPANKMVNSLRTSEKAWGSTIAVNIDELVDMLHKEERGAILTAIEIHGDRKLGMDQTNVQRVKTSAWLQYAGLAVFKDNQFVGLLSEEDSKSISFLNDTIKSTVERIACPEKGTLSMEITQSHTKIKGTFERGAPKIDVQINIIQNVDEVGCTINLMESATMDYINQKTAQGIQKRIEKTLETIQQYYQVDILGFCDALHRADAKQWKKIKGDWPTIFPELQVNIDVKVKTQGVGTLQNSLLNMPKEEE